MPRRVVPICSLPELRLAGGVEQHVVRHDQVRVGRDPQRARVDLAVAQPVELVGEHLRVDHRPVADHAQLVGIEDPARHQVQLEHLVAAHDCVAGVVAALEAHDRIGTLGEHVGDLALPFVAPLGADDHDSRHRPQCTAGPGCPRPGRRASDRARHDRVGLLACAGTRSSTAATPASAAARSSSSSPASTAPPRDGRRSRLRLRRADHCARRPLARGVRARDRLLGGDDRARAGRRGGRSSRSAAAEEFSAQGSTSSSPTPRSNGSRPTGS